MRKLLLLICALLTGISGAMAALSSSTIAKSGNVTDTWNITSALPTDNWTALSNVPAGVTALGSYTAYSRTQNITLSDEGALFITFLYSTGNHQLEILGVDLLNSNDEVVRSDYHYGKTGTLLSHNVYMLDHIASGNYKIRFIINSGVTNSVGNITVKHINIKTASSFENITNWYFVRMHSNSQHTKYMYYDKSEIGIKFSSSKQDNAHYLWGFVKDTDGIKIYNKAAGSSVAIDNANPCTLSASGQTFTFDTGHAGNIGAEAGEYFSLYVNPDKSATARSYLNYRVSSGNIQRWDSNDQGSTWMIDETTISAPFVSASEGKVYKIQAYFSNSDNLYFTNNGTKLAFNTSASSGVNDYWILRSSGNGDYPWRFESGRGDGKFLSSTDGLANTGVYLQINNIDSYFNLRGSKDGNAITSGIVNLGTWTGGKSGFGAYGEGGCWSSTGNSDRGWSTKYTIEEVTGVDIYTVVSNINAGGVNKTTYTGKSEQTNGGFYILASEPSAGDFSAISVTDFTPGAITVNTTTKTITVNYSSSYSYTLTDVNGQEYTGTITGEFGVTPTLTGCDGYTLSNEVWDEGTNTYTADITFPFAVSSNSVANWIYINIFDAKPNYKISDGYWFYWHANSTNVIVHNCDEPTNESGKIDEYKWAIVPSITNGAITFTIKNAVANKYIYHDGSESYDSHTGIKLGDTGVSLTYVKDASAAKYYWYIPSVEKYLSANSVNGGASQRLGALSAVHDGESVGFYTPADFTTLLTNLKTARTTFNNYLLPWSQGKYSETEEGRMTTAYAQQETDRNVVKDTPSAYFTASQFKTYTDNYNNAVDGLRYVMPTGKFIRIKNVGGTKYVKDLVANYNSDETLDYAEGGTDAASVFYVDASSKMIAYNSGLYLFATNNTPRITLQGYADTYEFLKGSAPLQVYVHSANNPIGWGGDNRYWSVNESSSKIDRVSTLASASEFLIETIESLPVTITAAGYATFNSPVAVSIPEGVTAFQAKISGNKDCVNLVSIDDDVIPANFPVVLKGAEGTYKFPITTTEVVAGDYHSNTLQGTIAAISVSSTIYTLQKNSDETGVGFYEKTNGTLKGFSAYLTDVSGLRGFIFNEITGIDNTVIDNVTIENAYDLSGRRAGKVKKGVYILDGKKVLF